MVAPALWVVCGIVFCAGGCNGQPPEQGMRLLAEARRLLASGNNAQAAGQMDQFLREFGGTSRAGEAHYLRGEARFRLNQLDQALADFAAALDRSSDRSVRGNALAALGDLAQRRGDLAAAQERYQEALALLPPSEPPSDGVAVRLGEVLQEQGKWEQADAQFHRVIHVFPGSDAAARAGRLVNARAWTVRAGAFADASAAQALARQLRQGRHEARVDVIFEDKTPAHAVQVGRFPTRQAGQAALADIQALVKRAQLAVAK